MTLDNLIGRMAEQTLGGKTEDAKNVVGATATSAGCVKQTANIAALGDSAELSDVVTALNSLLSGMKTAGIMVKDSTGS